MTNREFAKILPKPRKISPNDRYSLHQNVTRATNHPIFGGWLLVPSTTNLT